MHWDSGKQGEKMKVIVRARPLLSKEEEEIDSYEQHCLNKRRIGYRSKITQQALNFFSKYRHANPRQMFRLDHRRVSVFDQEYKNSEGKMKDYQFSGVFGESSSNQQIYDKVVGEAVQSAFMGFNSTLLAYGITGSGKTFTVFGHPSHDKDRGLCYFALDHLLHRQKSMQKDGGSLEIRLSFLQIYNQNLRDLLSEEGKKQVSLGQDKQGNVQIMDAVEAVITTAEQAVQLISIGSTRRASAATLNNQISSRSHAVLKINLTVTHNQQKMQSKLFIIDLAGSQKINSGSNIRKQQGSNINKSLLTLGNCINALVENSKKASQVHVPYRDSKLTRLLKDSLGGNARIIMVACISPHPFTIEETTTTLAYAERSRGIRRQITRNIISSEVQCPHCQMPNQQPTIHRELTPFELEQRPTQNDRSIECSMNVSQLLDKIYSDIVEQAKQSQKLRHIKEQMEEPNVQLQEVIKENEAQGNTLRMVLESLLKQTCIRNKTQEEDCSLKPQKKIIRLSSSRKNSRRKTEEDRKNEQDKENPTPKKSYQLQDFLKLEEPSTPLHILQLSQQKQRQTLIEKATEPQSESKRGDSVNSQKRRRSKLEYMGRPPRQTSRAMSSQRQSESKEPLFPG